MKNKKTDWILLNLLLVVAYLFIMLYCITELWKAFVYAVANKGVSVAHSIRKKVSPCRGYMR